MYKEVREIADVFDECIQTFNRKYVFTFPGGLGAAEVFGKERMSNSIPQSVQPLHIRYNTLRQALD